MLRQKLIRILKKIYEEWIEIFGPPDPAPFHVVVHDHDKEKCEHCK